MKSHSLFFAALWFVAVVGIIMLADSGGAAWLFRWIERTPGGDKAGHFVLIGGMALLLNLALRARRMPALGRHWLIGSLVVVALFTAEEYSQKFNRRRHFDYGDLAADYAGIWCAGWLALRMLRGTATS
jgi:multisubunit Na+/H+ antiporter MnhB subunit